MRCLQEWEYECCLEWEWQINMIGMGVSFSEWQHFHFVALFSFLLLCCIFSKWLHNYQFIIEFCGLTIISFVFWLSVQCMLFVHIPMHPWKYLNFFLLNSRPSKYLKEDRCLKVLKFHYTGNESPWIHKTSCCSSAVNE